MWRPLRRLIRRLFTVVGAVLILCAVGIGAFRLLVTQLPSYQDQVQAWARDALGLSVSFSGLDARLGLSGPELTFHDASVSRVGSEGSPMLSATEARLGLNVLSLFTTRRLEVNRLTLRGTRLTVERSQDGTLRVYRAPENGSESGFVLEDVPPVVVVVSDSTVIYDDRSQDRTWEFRDVRLELTRTMDEVVLEARGNAPERLGGRIELSAQASLRGENAGSGRDWTLFAQARDLNLAMLAALAPERSRMPESGFGDVSVWLDTTGADVSRSTVQVVLSDLELAGNSGDRYDNVELTAEWSRLEAGWALSLNNMNIRRGGRSWPQRAGVELRLERGETGLGELELRAGFLQLEDLSPLLPLLPESRWTRLWAELAPRGALADVDVRVSRGAGGTWDYAGSGSFHRVSVSSRAELPGMFGLSGEVRADSRSGRMVLATEDAGMDWPALFASPLEATELSGILVWRQGRDGLRVVSDDLVLNNGDARTRTTLELTLPMDGTSPMLELASNITDFDIAASARYLPGSAMPPDVLRYLESAILGGRVPAAEVTFAGPVRAFPFDDGSGRFEARVEVENGSMAYVDGWPSALDLTGTIDFRNAGWVARGSGRILGNETRSLQVGIEDVRDPVLSLSAETAGPLGDVVRFLKEAPLIARHLGPDLARLQARGGTGNVRFGLELPLMDRSAYRLDAALDVVDGEVSVSGFGPTAGDINGTLTLVEGDFRGEGIEATLLEGPVTVAVSLPDDPGYLASLAFDGEIDVEAVHRAFGLPLGGHFAGQTRWRGNLLLPATTYAREPREPLRIGIESNLSGVALRLPEPLSKAPDEPTSFELEFVFSESDRLEVSGHVGGARRFALSFRNRDGALSFRRGSVRFGGDHPVMPLRDGLTVDGVLGRLHLEEWWALLGGDPGAGLSSLLLGSELEIADFSAFGQHLGATRLMLRQEAAQWRLDVDSEPVAGTIAIPVNLADRPQILASMRRLNVSTGKVVGAAELDPRELPGLLLEADQFGVGQRRFGTLSADVQRDPLGLRLASFRTESESFSMEGNGGWFQNGRGPATRLALALESRDVADTLERLGLDPVTEAESADVELSVHWPDAPTADWTQSISGDLALRLERGSVVNLEPGAGRMMGLMSITALPRRLALDFRDVFNRGLVFDEVNGDFVIVEGNAYTDNLHLTGPVADIGVVGRTGLRDHDYQQQAVVTAEPGRILPTMGFLAGPQVGAALLIFTQIFKEPLKGIGRASYCVTGSWYEPAVDRLTPSELESGELCADLPPGTGLPRP